MVEDPSGDHDGTRFLPGDWAIRFAESVVAWSEKMSTFPLRSDRKTVFPTGWLANAAMLPLGSLSVVAAEARPVFVTGKVLRQPSASGSPVLSQRRSSTINTTCH